MEPLVTKHSCSKSQSPFDLSMYYLRELWSAGSQNDLGLQLLCQLAVTGLQQKTWRGLMASADALSQGPADAPHSANQFRASHKMTWFGYHSCFFQCIRISTLYLYFNFPKVWAVVRSVATDHSQISEGRLVCCKEFQVCSLFHCDKV